jgi:hypothetical protein
MKPSLLEWVRRHGGRGAVLALLLANLAACGLLREPLPTPRPTAAAIGVTADQVAQAMEADQFYATYGQTTLLIQGTVASVNQQPNHLILELATRVPTRVLCDLGNQAASAKVGDTITVVSANPERDVSRQASAVMIKNCSIP